MDITKAIKDYADSVVMENFLEVDAEESFRRMLGEVYSFTSVGGPFEWMHPADVLEECDLVAYQCGLNDFVDGENLFEIDGCYYTPVAADRHEEIVDILGEYRFTKAKDKWWYIHPNDEEWEIYEGPFDELEEAFENITA
jgi:hypothetical protein